MGTGLKVLAVTVLSMGLLYLAHASDEGDYQVNVYSQSPDKTSRVYGDIRLMTSQDQTLYVYNGVKKLARIYAKLPFRYEPQITWHGNDLVEVTIGTGSPGRFSLFYNLRNDMLSEPMWFVLAFDKTRKLAVLGEDRLRVVKVFENKEVAEIKRSDFQDTGILFLIVDEASFDAKGNLHFTYQNNTGGVSKAAINASDMGN